MKMIQNNDLLAHTQRVAADRKAKAIARRRQAVLQDITPGTATPGTVARYIRKAA
jgi:hypothetical protein